jgi:radical SAM superfamily enzyme YgiQ (UPF0313 family)
MKIAFIVPKDHDPQGPLSEFVHSRIFPPASLARMAGLAARHAHVTSMDERIDSALHLPQADIAIIFINSYNRYRAYEVAQLYSERGSLTVFTGPMLSQAPEEACRYADCVFIGAGEQILPGFLEDYCHDKPRRLYASVNSSMAPASETSGNGALTLCLA